MIHNLLYRNIVYILKEVVMKLIKTVVNLIVTAWVLLDFIAEVRHVYKRKVKEAYRKGRTDCVDDFVKGFAFTNGKVITIESEHNGSITVKTIG